MRLKPGTGGKNSGINFEYTSVDAARLGWSIKQIMQEQILPLRRRFEAVAKCWEQLLPAELARHCKIVHLSQGRLKIEADSPSYLYELKLRSSQILEQLQKFCPSAGIKTINFILG